MDHTFLINTGILLTLMVGGYITLTSYTDRCKLFILQYIIPLIPVRLRNKPYQFTMGWDQIHIPSDLEQAFYAYYYRRSSSGDKTLHAKEMGDILKAITVYVKQHCSKQQSKDIPIVCVTDKDTMDYYIDNRMPFVIKGGHNHRLTFEEIVNVAKDTEVMFNSREDGKIITYTDKLSTIEHTRDYVANCESLLHKHPELIPNVSLIDSLDMLDNDYAKYPSKQLFLSNKLGNGTPLHCAWTSNMFYQIDGKKKWVFVHPNNTHFMYGFLQDSGLYSGSISMSTDMVQHSDTFELLSFCPRYSAVLEPGDILYNPEAWWHGVTNLTETSVGIATRWEQTSGFYKTFQSNLWLSCMKNHNLVATLEEIYNKLGHLSLNVDEHMEGVYTQQSLSFLETRVQGDDPTDIHEIYPMEN